MRVSPAAWQSRAIKRQCRLIGFRKCGKEQMDRFNAGAELKAGDCYFITAPTYETKSEKYGWINAVQAVAKMTSIKGADHVDADIFVVK